MTLGERIRQRRIELSITQEELALSLNTTKQTIHKYEKNIVTNIPSDRICSLAKALSTTPSFLLGWSETNGETLSGKDADLINVFHKLSIQSQDHLIKIAEILSK